MQAPRLKSTGGFPHFWRLRCAVASDPRLRGEPKQAWEFLFVVKAQLRLATIDVSPEEIAADQGRDARCGYRCLEALEACGYVEIIDRPRRSRDALARSGPWKVFLCDPLEVAIARPGPKSDSQGELPFLQDCGAADEPEILPADLGARIARADRPGVVAFAQPPGAVVAQHPQPHPPLARAQTSETSEKEDLYKTSDLGGLRRLQGGTNQLTTPKAPIDRGYGAASAEAKSAIALRNRSTTSQANLDPGAIPSIGEHLLAAVMRGGLGPAERVRECERLIRVMQRACRDGKLRQSPCLKRAEAILDGAWSEHELMRVLNYAGERFAAGRCPNGWTVCFIGASKRSMLEFAERRQ